MVFSLVKRIRGGVGIGVEGEGDLVEGGDDAPDEVVFERLLVAVEVVVAAEDVEVADLDCVFEEAELFVAGELEDMVNQVFPVAEGVGGVGEILGEHLFEGGDPEVAGLAADGAVLDVAEAFFDNGGGGFFGRDGGREGDGDPFGSEALGAGEGAGEELLDR